MSKSGTSLKGSDLWDRTAIALERGDFSALEEMLADANVSVMELLDSNDASQKHWDEALTWASFVGRTDIARQLLDRGVDPAAGIATGLAALHWAANRGNPETVKLLIDRGAPLEQKNMYDGTVLSCTLWSAIHEHRPAHAEIVELLIQHGAEFGPDWLGWWDEQPVPSDETKQRIADALRR
jgi:hypothetical protein